MEALAALKSAKKKRAQELEELEAAERAKRANVVTFEEKVAKSVEFGFAPPPLLVFCAGKDKSAAVWWIYDESMEGIEAWEVHRYRKDDKRKESNDWQHKGSHTFTDIAMLQVRIPELSNDFEYRFSIKAVNSKGAGLESPLSNITMVEAPLPQGWSRFHDKKSDKYYYASVKTNRSSWSRPEIDPFFIEDEIIENFEAFEIAHLQELFNEDMAHFQEISVEQFRDIMRECGEKLSLKRVKELFKAFAGSLGGLRTWKEFLLIINHVKKHRVEPFSFSTMVKDFFTRQRAKLILRPNRDKLGEWKMEFNELVSRYYYVHAVTGECMWQMPDEVKFYVPRALLNKLLRVFDLDDMEEFKQYFALLDIDNSGDLSDKEISKLLLAMGVEISPTILRKLIKAIDINQNGTVEFDEFCWMLYELRKKDKQGVFGELGGAKSSRDLLGADAGGVAAGGSLKGTRRGSFFGGEAWQQLSLGGMKTAVYDMRGRKGGEQGLAPLAPLSPSNRDDHSLMDFSPGPPSALSPSAPVVAKRGCGCFPSKKVGYTPQVFPSSSASPKGRSRSRRGSVKFTQSAQNAAILSPSGKAYQLQEESLPYLESPVPENWGDGRAPLSRAPSKASLREKHDKHCFCGCRAF